MIRELKKNIYTIIPVQYIKLVKAKAFVVRIFYKLLGIEQITKPRGRSPQNVSSRHLRNVKLGADTYRLGETRYRNALFRPRLDIHQILKGQSDLNENIKFLGDMGAFSSALVRSDNIEPGRSRHIVMLVVSALRIDPRVEREARSLADAGYRVTIICPDISDPKLEVEPLDWGNGIEFDILGWEAANYTNIAPWLMGDQMLEAALKYDALAYHCHDLSTALIGLSAARETGARCVCDFHEWYSENVSWFVNEQNCDDGKWGPHPADKRQIYKATESLVLSRADEVITVCESIARELKLENGNSSKQIHVVRNIPSIRACESTYKSLREQLNISDKQVLMLWQGGTGPTRLLEPVIEALAITPNVVFAIRGPSLNVFGAAYRKLAERIGVQDRLFLLPPVESSHVVEAAKSADIGVWTLPNLSKNFYYALPNKIFEYLAAGLPIVCANYPEAANVIQKYKVGLTFDPYNPVDIARALVEMGNAEFRLECSQNAVIALREMNAANEWQKIVGIYDKF